MGHSCQLLSINKSNYGMIDEDTIAMEVIFFAIRGK